VAPAAQAQQLTLSWVDNSGGQAGFVIHRASSSGGGYSRIAEVLPGVVAYTDKSVSFGTTYCYRVAAVDATGMSEFSNQACASPSSGGITLKVSKAGNGAGSVSSSPAGIDCGTTCSYSYPAGKTVTLTATASSGSSFGGWAGGGCSGTAPCTLVGNSLTSVTATFNLVSTTGGSLPSPTTPATPATLTLAYKGMLRDRVGQGTAALAPDGAMDGTFTVLLHGAGGRTVTGLRLNSSAPGAWDTSSSSAYWVLAVAPTLDAAPINAPGTMAVNFQVPDGGSFVIFGSDRFGTEFLPGRTITLAATFADGSTASAVTTVPNLAPATASLTFNGMLRDRVGQGSVALNPDGSKDAALTATLTGTLGRAVTGLRLDSNAPGTWDTSSSSSSWILGVAPTLDAPLLNKPDTAGVSFPVADGGHFVVFASDSLGAEFFSGRILTLTVTLEDGSTAVATTTVPKPVLHLAYNGKLRDRVGQGNVLSPDGPRDGTLTATLSATGGRTITSLRLESDGPGAWDTTIGTIYWVLGVASSLDGPLLNASATMAVNFWVADGGSFVLFAADYQNKEFVSGRKLTLTAAFSDGTMTTVTITLP